LLPLELVFPPNENRESPRPFMPPKGDAPSFLGVVFSADDENTIGFDSGFAGSTFFAEVFFASALEPCVENGFGAAADMGG